MNKLKYLTNFFQEIIEIFSSNNYNKINVLSCFDGISCAQVALERANIKVNKYYSSEIDKNAIQITQKNYPNTIQLGNIVDLHLNEKIDLMIGGSPCQDLSKSNTSCRLGLNGAKSGLFYEFVRLLNEIKPKYFILENVASMQETEKEKITNALFGIQPIMINAALVSAQQRQRYFWVGKLENERYIKINITQPKDKKIYVKDILEKNIDEKYFIKEKANLKTPKSKDNSKTIKVGYIRNNKQLNQIYSIYGKTATLTTKKPLQYLLDNGTIRTLTPLECERLQSLSDNYTKALSDNQRYKVIGNAFNVEVISHILKELFNEK